MFAGPKAIKKTPKYVKLIQGTYRYHQVDFKDKKTFQVNINSYLYIYLCTVFVHCMWKNQLCLVIVVCKYLKCVHVKCADASRERAN